MKAPRDLLILCWNEISFRSTFKSSSSALSPFIQQATARLAAASPLTLQQSSPAPSANAFPTNSIPRADSIASLDFRTGVSTSPTSLSRPGSRSAGPSPLTVGMPSTSGPGGVDSIPLAVAFQEVVHALFRGTDESRWHNLPAKKKQTNWQLNFTLETQQVPSANQRRHDALISSWFGPVDQCTAQPQHTAYIIPNPQFPEFGKRRSQQTSAQHVRRWEKMLIVDRLENELRFYTVFSFLFVACTPSREQDLMSVEPVFHFNMPQLTLLLKRQAEQNPSASYFNVDILKVNTGSETDGQRGKALDCLSTDSVVKRVPHTTYACCPFPWIWFQYQVKAQSGTGSAPLHLVAYWKCEPSQTDVRLDYKFNAHAQAAPAPLRNLMISVPIEGAVTSMQAKPQGEW